MRQLAVSVLLAVAACANPPPAETAPALGETGPSTTAVDTGPGDTGTGDPGSIAGTADYVCQYSYVFPDRTETGEWVGHTMACETYVSVGSQLVDGDEGVCELLGAYAGATSATCTCAWELSDDCSPETVND